MAGLVSVQPQPAAHTHTTEHLMTFPRESMASGRLLDAAFQLHYTVKELKRAWEADDYSLKH